MNSTNAILDALAQQKRHGETSLIATIEPALMQDARTALRDYRTLFAPFIPGSTDTAPIYAMYDAMYAKTRAHTTKHSILLLVECQNTEEFGEAIDQLPVRTSAERRALEDDGDWDFEL